MSAGPASASPTRVFGVRHHGPGCARSLVTALEALNPDAVLIEPAELLSLCLAVYVS